jgi:hypothetical protein
MIPDCEILHAQSTRAQVEGDEQKERKILINEILALKQTLKFVRCERVLKKMQVLKKN